MPRTPDTPPPGEPSEFKAVLNSDGSVRVTWKCKNPPGSQGTIYVVRRKLLNSTVWQPFGITGSKFVIDASIPSNSGGAVYQVTAQRGNLIGDPSVPFTLQFGVDGGGMVIASQFEGNGANRKMAA